MFYVLYDNGLVLIVKDEISSKRLHTLQRQRSTKIHALYVSLVPDMHITTYRWQFYIHVCEQHITQVIG